LKFPSVLRSGGSKPEASTRDSPANNAWRFHPLPVSGSIPPACLPGSGVCPQDRHSEAPRPHSREIPAEPPDMRFSSKRGRPAPQTLRDQIERLLSNICTSSVFTHIIPQTHPVREFSPGANKFRSNSSFQTSQWARKGRSDCRPGVRWPVLRGVASRRRFAAEQCCKPSKNETTRDKFPESGVPPRHK